MRENTNGLLRDYFPQATDLAAHLAERLSGVQDELNNRPPECLNRETPAAVFARLRSDHSCATIATLAGIRPSILRSVSAPCP